MIINVEKIKNNEILVVSSRQIAEDFEKEHKEIVRAIEGYSSLDGKTRHSGIIEGLKQGGELTLEEYFIKSDYKGENGKTYTEYLLTRDGFSLLVMGFTGQKALEWKLKYIKGFNAMETQLKKLYDERKQWEIERAKGVLVRHILTDTIKMKVADSSNKKFMYPNYTKLIYKAIFGKSLEELRKDYSVKGKESIRDYLTAEQLKEVEGMEMLVSGLISLGMGYSEIKAFINEKYDSRLLTA